MQRFYYIVIVISLFLGNSVFLFGETEPNNSFDEANEVKINEEFKGRIQNRGDEDFFKFKVEHSGIIQVNINNISSRIYPVLEIFDKNKKSINKVSGDYRWMWAKNFVCDTGDYYLKFYTRYGKGSSDKEYSVEIKLSVPDSFECNNTIDQASFIDLDQKIIAALQNNNDVDYYRVDIKSSGLLKFYVKNLPRNILSKVELIDPQNNVIYSKNVNPKNPSVTFQTNLCLKGAYHIVITNVRAGDNFILDQYEMMVSMVSYDAYECNNTLETASTIGLNQKIVAAIQNKGDVDYYAIDLGETGILSLNLNKIPKSISTKVVFFNPSDSTIIHSDVVDSLSVSTLFKGRICKKGRYYIVIRDDDDKDFSFDQYEFELALKKTDPHECNNTFEDATKIKIGETLKGFIDVKGDLDYYTFNNPGVGLVTARVNSVSAKIAPYLLVYNSDRELVTELKGSKSEDKLLLDFAACKGKEYYLVFKDKDGTAEDETNPYEIMLSHETLEKYECNNTIETSTPIIYGSIIRANIRPAGDLDFYAIKLEKDVNYRLMVDLIPDSIDIVAGLYQNGNPNPVFEEKRLNGDTISKEFKVSDSGIFYLKLEDNEGDDFSTSDYYLLFEKEIVTNLPITGDDKKQIKIIPNPSSNFITIFGAQYNIEILLVDLAGKTVLRSNSNFIDISSLKRGMYFVKTKNGMEKLIKN